MKLYNALTTTIGDKEHTIKDINGVYPISRLMGENANYYGGRVKKYSRAKDNNNLILLIQDVSDKMVVIDVAVEKLEHFPRAILKAIAKRRKIKYAVNITTEDLVSLLV